MACEAERAHVASLQQQLRDENQQADGLPHGPDRTQLLEVINEHQAELVTAKQALEDCLATAPPPPPPVTVVAAPRDILDIQHTNPAPPAQGHHLWTSGIVGGSATKAFPDIDFEWVNVLDPALEYDNPAVGATGEPDRDGAGYGDRIPPFGLVRLGHPHSGTPMWLRACRAPIAYADAPD